MVHDPSPHAAERVHPHRWWNDKGRKMRVQRLDERHGWLRIANADIAAVKIERPRGGDRNWKLYWSVKHIASRAEGHIILDESGQSLRAAFALLGGNRFMSDQFVLDQFVGDAALAGTFIRHGNKLNIPGPGLPWQGSGTVSILLDEEIKAAVEKLME